MKKLIVALALLIAGCVAGYAQWNNCGPGFCSVAATGSGGGGGGGGSSLNTEHFILGI